MSTTQSNKIKQYMATAAALLGATAVQAQTQYLYTDIDDTTVVDGVFELDLDGDTIVDFTIEHILQGGQLSNVNAILLHPGDSIGGNLAVGSGQNGFSYVENVIPGTALNSNATFTGISNNTDIGYLAFRVDGVAYPNSNWAGPVTDGYLGLRILKDDTACFGWLRLDVADSAKSFTIKDWSFNTNKDSSHTVAFELLDVMETVLKDLRISQSNGLLQVSLGQELPLSIYNAAGRLMTKTSPEFEQRVSTLGWSSGMYIIRIEGSNWYHNVKIWID